MRKIKILECVYHPLSDSLIMFCRRAGSTAFTEAEKYPADGRAESKRTERVNGKSSERETSPERLLTRKQAEGDWRGGVGGVTGGWA